VTIPNTTSGKQQTFFVFDTSDAVTASQDRVQHLQPPQDAWFLTHVPFHADAPAESATWKFLDTNLRIALILTGHTHWWQLYRNDTPLTEFILGTGGAELQCTPKPPNGVLCPSGNTVMAGETSNWGFTVFQQKIEPTSNSLDWWAFFYDSNSNGRPSFRCQATGTLEPNPDVHCSPSK